MKFLRLTVFIFGMAFCLHSHGGAEAKVPKGKMVTNTALETVSVSEWVQDEIVGLVIDHTQTQAAHNFYNAFASALLEEENPIPGFTWIAVEEIPSSRSGGLVNITNEKGVLAQLAVNAQTTARAQALGIAAATLVRQKLAEQMLGSRLFADPDLGTSELTY